MLGVPVLWYGAWHLRRELDTELAANDFMINMGHAADSLRAAATNVALSKFADIHFQFSDESSGILGSSGALWKIADWAGGDTLAVANADVVSFPSWKKMLEFHRRHEAGITLHVRNFSSSAEVYTHLVTSSDHRITAFGPKQNAGLMFSGAYLIDSELLRRLPPGGSDLRKTLLEPMAAAAAKKGGLYAYEESSEWLDCGTVETFSAAQFDLLQKFPSARPLVATLMRETSPGCWVPRNWKSSPFTLNAPAVVCGDESAWKSAKLKSAGPRFVGLSAPSRGLKENRDVVVFSDHIQKI